MDPAQNIDYKSFNLDQFTIVQHQTSCSNNIQKPVFKFRHAQNAPTISLEQKDDKYSLLGSYVHVSNNHTVILNGLNFPTNMFFTHHLCETPSSFN